MKNKRFKIITNAKTYVPRGFYKVGGFVRDTYLGLDPDDIDLLAVGYTPEELEKTHTLTGKDFPVFRNKKGHEIAVPRLERKKNNDLTSSEGYKGFEVHTENVTAVQDLRRRDLTINALLMLSNTEIFDPFGGVEDLNKKVLRHVSEAFAEDPVRVLRLARFKGKFPDFSIAQDTKDLCFSMKDRLPYLTKERVMKETRKALMLARPSHYFRALLDMDVLDVLFPSLFALVGVLQNHRFHAEGDSFDHVMLVLDNTARNPLARLGALYHDIGKGVCAKAFDYECIDSLTAGAFKDHNNRDLLEPLLKKEFGKFSFHKKEKQLISMVTEFHTYLPPLLGLKNKSLVKCFHKKGFPKTKEEYSVLVDVVVGDMRGHIHCIPKEGFKPRMTTPKERTRLRRDKTLEAEDCVFLAGDSNLTEYKEVFAKLGSLYDFKPDIVKYKQQYKDKKGVEPSIELIRMFILTSSRDFLNNKA